MRYWCGLSACKHFVPIVPITRDPRKHGKGRSLYVGFVIDRFPFWVTGVLFCVDLEHHPWLFLHYKGRIE
jgi:hypothetical protein